MARENWYFQHGCGYMRSRRINAIRRHCGYGGVFSYLQILEAAIPGGGIILLDDGDDVEEQIMDAVDPVDPEAVRKVLDIGIKKGWIVIGKNEITIMDDVFSRPASVPSAKPQAETEDTEPEDEIEATPEEIERAEKLFMALWDMYPRKTNKDRVTVQDKLRLARMGRDECISRMEAYEHFINSDPDHKWATGSSFFTSAIFKFSANKGKKTKKNPVPVPEKAKEQDLSPEAIDEVIIRDGLKRANWEEKKGNYSMEAQAAIEAALTR